MRLHHLALAVLIAAIWGFNFVVLQLGLQQIPPQLLCVLRFMGASFPAIFFIKKPATSWRLIILYGLVIFALQFTLLFSGIKVGMAPGLASLLMQTQVFFTLFLAFIFLDEKPRKGQILGAMVSFAGIALVAAHLGGKVSWAGFFLVIAAAFAWSVGSLISKKIGKVNMFSLITWGSFVAWPPLLLLSLIIDGPEKIFLSLHQLSGLSIMCVLYIIYLSTIFCFMIWNSLLAHYPATLVAPFMLLVPIFGMLSALLFLNESFQPWKLLAAILVITGLVMNILARQLATFKLYLLNMVKDLRSWKGNKELPQALPTITEKTIL